MQIHLLVIIHVLQMEIVQLVMSMELFPKTMDFYIDTPDKCMSGHQTDTACSWSRGGGECKLYPPSPPLRRPGHPVFLGKPAVRPRSMAGGAPTPCGRH